MPYGYREAGAVEAPLLRRGDRRASLPYGTILPMRRLLRVLAPLVALALAGAGWTPRLPAGRTPAGHAAPEAALPAAPTGPAPVAAADNGPRRGAAAPRRAWTPVLLPAPPDASPDFVVSEPLRGRGEAGRSAAPASPLSIRAPPVASI